MSETTGDPSVLTPPAAPEPEVEIWVNLAAGRGRASLWTCDLSYDYVKINAEYTT